MKTLTSVKQEALEKFIMPGRMMGGTKRGPEGHVCVWNANIFTRENGKIWFGDLDLTTDADKLIALATGFGETLYILREYDGRFERETDPAWDKAVAHVTAEGLTLVSRHDS